MPVPFGRVMTVPFRFGNGGVGVSPAAAITSEEIIAQLATRGYQAGAYRTTETPQYTREQSIQMGVSSALKSARLPQRASAGEGILPSSKWNPLVANCIKITRVIAARVLKSRQLTA